MKEKFRYQVTFSVEHEISFLSMNRDPREEIHTFERCRPAQVPTRSNKVQTRSSFFFAGTNKEWRTKQYGNLFRIGLKYAIVDIIASIE